MTRPTAEPTTIKPGRKDSIENQEEFLVQNRIGIVQKLHLLAKSNCMVTATYANCFPINRNKLEARQRIGCAFVNMSFGTNIQRYIHELKLLRRRTDN